MSDIAKDHGRQRRLLRRAGGRAGAKPQRFSTLLRQLIETGAERLTLAELVAAVGDRAFGALMVVFAIPNLIPLPPGSSAVLGVPLILIAGQLTVGRRMLWLPSVLGRRSVRRSDLGPLVERVVPWLRRVERLLSPRLTFLFGPVGDRVIGLVCLLMAVILFLPIPLVNVTPALAIVLMGMALLQRDGLAALAGFAVALGTALLLGAVSGALWISAKAFLHTLSRMVGMS